MNVHISHMTLEVETIARLTNDLSTKFALLMKDKSIHVHERFDLFCKAPSSLKNHWSCSQFDVLKQYGILFYDDLYIERHQTTDTVDLIEQIEDGNRNVLKRIDGQITVEELVALLMEEILQDNLGSFRFDW